MLADFENYSYPCLKGMRKPKKKKIMISIVYDFLKKNNILSEYMETFMKIHPHVIIKRDRMSVKKCIEYRVDGILDERVDDILDESEKMLFRDFFYDIRISFYLYVTKNTRLWTDIDIIWYRIINTNKGFKL